MDPYQELPIFQALASHYHIAERASLGMSRLWRRIGLNRARIKRGDHVLDLMCGDGKVWPRIRHIIGKEGSLEGIDYCKEMLKRLPDKEQAQATCGAFQENSIASNSKDVVFCSFGIKSLETSDLKLLMLEVQRILKPGGRFALIELKMPKNPFLQLLISVQLGFFSLISKTFCPEKMPSITHLKHYMLEFAQTNHQVFHQAKGLDVKTSSAFGGLLLLVWGGKFQ